VIRTVHSNIEQPDIGTCDKRNIARIDIHQQKYDFPRRENGRYKKLIIKTYRNRMNADVIDRKIIAIFVVLIIALLGVSYAAPNGKFVLVITNPFQAEIGAMDVISNAGGTFVSESNFTWITVAHSDDIEFSSRLRQAGALLVMNHRIALGCVRI
jgi:hypothetical protein